VKAKGKEFYQIVFDQTPFYGEAGGQMGDSGYIYNDEEKIIIGDTLRENNLIIHISEQLPKDPQAGFTAVVDLCKRNSTARNHSATHLMHLALREILGTHVEQKGSLVNPDRLRFDFSHFQKLTDEEIRLVERSVNKQIRENNARDEKRAITMDEAKAMGAMALFGEKYGDKVRVIRFGQSAELCGGTHVHSTGEIGFFKIISEGAIAAGIRRIEAITGEAAELFVDEEITTLAEIRNLLKAPKEIIKTVTGLQEELSQLRKQLQEAARDKARALKGELDTLLEDVNGIKFYAGKVSLDAQGMKDLSFEMKDAHENLFLVLAAEIDGKANLSVCISEGLATSKSLDASKIVRELAKEIQGGGGGQAFFATAGGKNPAGIENALKQAREMVNDNS
jgi:alanyl-tRNA synthetase